jgi:hypothetical protein
MEEKKGLEEEAGGRRRRERERVCVCVLGGFDDMDGRVFRLLACYFIITSGVSNSKNSFCTADSWFMPSVTREQADEMLTRPNALPGDFLVRKSSQVMI